MVKVRCKDCGAEVPVLREFCQNCGAPTDLSLRERQHQLGPGPRQRSDGGQKGKRKTFLIAAAALLGLGAVANNWFDPDFDFDFDSDDHRVVIVDRDEPRGAVTIEADDLYKAYRDNPEGAQERFEDREMVVSGTFLRIVPDGYGSLDLRLATSNPNAQVGVDLADLAVEDGKALRPGQRFTVSWQGMGDGGDELWVRDCAIQPNAETDAGPSAPGNASSPGAPATPAAGNNSEG